MIRLNNGMKEYLVLQRVYDAAAPWLAIRRIEFYSGTMPDRMFVNDVERLPVPRTTNPKLGEIEIPDLGAGFDKVRDGCYSLKSEYLTVTPLVSGDCSYALLCSMPGSECVPYAILSVGDYSAGDVDLKLPGTYMQQGIPFALVPGFFVSV